MSASANNTSPACTICERRRGGDGGASGATARRRLRELKHLSGVGPVESESFFNQGLQPSETLGAPNVSNQLGPLRNECGTLSVQLVQGPGARRPNRAAPNHDARHRDKAKQRQRDAEPRTRGYAALRHARNLALRARGLAATSSAEATTDLRVTFAPNARALQVQTGCLGGHTQARLHS